MTQAARQLVTIVTLLAALGGCAPKALDNGTPLVWPDNKGDFQKKVTTLKLTPEQAYDAAEKLAVQKEYTAVDKEPLLIVGDEYLFGTPSPRGVWLTGFYVNGQTGAVEFRKVDRLLYRGMVADLLHP